MLRISAVLFLVMFVILAFLIAVPASADTGRDLVSVCGQSASLCSSDFQSDQLAEILKANACIPTDAGKAEAGIVAWLGRHPRAQALEIAASVRAASNALWPCKK
jgi:hypothetical protein